VELPGANGSFNFGAINRARDGISGSGEIQSDGNFVGQCHREIGNDCAFAGW
jgi:hypothetical protein